ncbi:MAG: STAS domain-containing protein [Candidatus Omnitrophica bacterium]|nr:STAS domain-containing protein [Candidatus Omnitrophota bacterium]
MTDDTPRIMAKEEGDLITVSMGGALNSATLPISRQLVDEIIKSHNIYQRTNLKILVDYKDVTDVDSSTIANILERLTEHQKHNHKIAFINVSEEFKTIVQLHKLEKEIPVFDSKQKALKALLKPTQ